MALWTHQPPIPRQHRSNRLQTREARAKLVPRMEPWYEIERGRAIGYRRGLKAVGFRCSVVTWFEPEYGPV
jgi:uncharacterized protein (DUF2336 family)